MCIVDPAERRLAERGGLAGLFASHPPIRERAARLRAMAYQPQPAGG
jgi:Zn-dependent protease with chaperone function